MTPRRDPNWAHRENVYDSLVPIENLRLQRRRQAAMRSAVGNFLFLVCVIAAIVIAANLAAPVAQQVTARRTGGGGW